MGQRNIITDQSPFSDLPVGNKGRIRRLDILILIFEILTWATAIFITGFFIIFNPFKLQESFPYILFGMMLASSFWYLQIRTLYIKLHKEKAQAEKSYDGFRARQLELDKKEKEFIIMTSHQLNTPLSVVRNASSELNRIAGKSKKCNEKEKRYITMINSSSKKMVEYLGDLIEFIKSDKTVLKLNCQPVDVKELVDRAGQRIGDALAKNKKLLKVQIDPEIEKIFCDSNRALTALVNILDNAIFYSNEKSEIVLTIKPVNNYAEFSIRNSGDGILAEDSQHIFQRFYRSTNSKKANPFGTGLGLSITRDIIVQQGGTIWFESTPKEFTAFYFTLPKV